MSATPEPKPVRLVCSICERDWQQHLAGPRKKNPTLEDCVRVLKADLARRPPVHNGIYQPYTVTSAGHWVQ